MIRAFAKLLLAGGLALALPAGAQPSTARDGLDAQIPVPPMHVTVRGQERISYEIHLANFSSDRLEVRRVAAVDARGASPLIELSADVLAAATATLGGAPRRPGESVFLDPGQGAVVFMDASLPPGRTIGLLRHEIDYVVVATGARLTLRTPALMPDRHEPSLIDPPLGGGPWVAIHSAAWPRGHRRVFYAVAGQAKLPGRFAIDWVKLDGNGRLSHGDPDLARDAYGYGDDVLAVANASVAAVRDGMGEPARLSQRTQHPSEDDAGNYVALRLPDGRFAFYEHLRKGSIRVRVGEKVSTGQVLGSLGFSGESTGPHLHFHVADGLSPLDAEGVPFEIRRFRELGRYGDISKLGHPWVPSKNKSVRHDEWPDANVVVDFGHHAR